MTSLFDLSGRVAVVSGAASGLGQQMALGFADAGADVVAVDINQAGSEETAHEIGNMGRRSVAIRCDVSDVEQIRALYRAVDDEFGRVDVVGNVAGEGRMCPPEDLPIEHLHEVLQNIAVGRFASCQEAGRRMLGQGKGSIINLGSIAGWNSLGRGHVPYGMSMAAVIQMTRELATEWASRGVRVNAILPSQVWNAGLRERIARVPELEETFKGGIPMARLGNPEEIRGPAVFLASDASSFVTGAIIPMDGGNLAMNAGGSYPGSPRSYA